MKRLVRKASKEQVSKAKELCKAIKFALEKNDVRQNIEFWKGLHPDPLVYQRMQIGLHEDVSHKY